MTPYYTDEWLTLYGGDCREVLVGLSADSVDCVVTSPPYWGLRDYGTATWIGGDEACDHARLRSSGSSTLGAGKGKSSMDAAARREASVPMPFRDVCGKCGATRIDSQLGLERTPDCDRRGMFRLRADLTDEQREYVARRLAGVERRDE